MAKYSKLSALEDALVILDSQGITLTPATLLVFLHVAANDGSQLIDLETGFGISKSNFYAALRRLGMGNSDRAQLHLIRSEAMNGNKRRLAVHLTKQGEQLIKDLTCND